MASVDDPNIASSVDRAIVVFDLDGTLIDSEGLILESYRHTMRSHLGEAPPDFQSGEVHERDGHLERVAPVPRLALDPRRRRPDAVEPAVRLARGAGEVHEAPGARQRQTQSRLDMGALTDDLVDAGQIE